MLFNNPAVLFDLDGTITQQELLPCIAKELGLQQEMDHLTALAIEGKVPFAESLRNRVDILKQVPIAKVCSIIGQVKLNDRLVAFIRRFSAACYIVTGNLDVWVSSLCSSICNNVFTSVAVAENDELLGLSHVLDKYEVAKQLRQRHDFIIAVGEGHNDAGMMQVADVGIAFGAVHKPASSVLETASHAIYSQEVLCRFLQPLLSVPQV